MSARRANPPGDPRAAVAALPDKPAANLARATILGVGWLIGQSLSARAIGFLSQIALARLLMPADFAILALAGTVTTLIGMLVNFGVDDVLLQRQQRMRYWRLPAMIVTLALGTVSMLAVFAVSPLAARAYDSPVLIPMLAIMALGMPFGALSTVPTAELRAALNFRFLAGYNTAELIAQQAMTVVLATMHFGPFSFAIPGPLLGCIRSVVFWSVTRPPLQRMRPRQLRILGARGSMVFGTKIITALVGQGDYIVLGLIAAKPVVGAYFFAYRLAFQPISMLAGSISTVLFPALAKLRDQRGRQGETALEASEMLAFVAMPLCFLQAALAPSLLPLVFGHRWNDAVPLVQILSVALAFDAISWIAGAMLNARGEFRRSLIYSCVFSPFFFLFVAAGAIEHQATGAAVGVLFFYVLVGPVYSYLVFRDAGIGLLAVLRLYAWPATISLVAIGGPLALVTWWTPDRLLQFIAVGITGSLLSWLGMSIFARPVYRKIKQRAKSLIHGRSAETVRI